MGCFDSVKHWDHIALCFAKPDTETGCSYDKMTRLGFDNWGTGFCCCRSEKCNQLPPEWLALSSWRLRWRICSNFLIMATVFSFAFYGYGLLESQSRKTLGKKKKRKRKSEKSNRKQQKSDKSKKVSNSSRKSERSQKSPRKKKGSQKKRN
ncbi:unnamed protein product [Cylicocyclus nassatus]|uniref:Uncharacterized protein n=1 Tax=Cylicocyclus nassatus TaxID=53992 RepID=A0AA36DSG9_CYLNA|nr:unnamed protein product [Cylicocyclus nassatus]